MTGARIHVAGLQRRFPVIDGEVVALGGVDLDVEPGEWVAVLGHSGSGKSSLLHILGAMDTQTSGKAVVEDVDLASLRPSARAAFRRRVGFVFQAFHLLLDFSVLENVVAPVVPFERGRVARARASLILEELGLAGRETARPGELSGGEQQRVAVARALVGDPILILADEPTGNLDDATGANVLDALFGAVRARRSTLLVVTHDPRVAERCERVVHLARGKVISDSNSSQTRFT